MSIEKKSRPRSGASRRRVSEPRKASLKSSATPLLKTGGWLVLLVVLFQGGSWLLGQLDMPITRIQVAGQLQHVDRLALQSWFTKNTDQGMLKLSLEDVQAHVMANPWVESATVRRRWPDTLYVDIIERVPVARWNKARLLTRSAQTFAISGSLESFNVPHLSGPEGSEAEVWHKYLWINEVLGELGLTVARLTKEERGAWQLSLQQNPASDIYIGRFELEQRLARFKVLYRQVLSQRFQEVVRVDLRYTNGAAVKWQVSKTVG